MDTTEAFSSFVLSGIRLDSATLAQATTAAWEGALSRAGMRVMLVDMWTLLLGQRDFGLWEALSAADYVYPIADDVLLRRAAHHQGMTVMKPDLLVYDLLDAAARANRPVGILASAAEVESDVALVRRIWPQLQITGLTRGDEELYEPDRKLIGAINMIAPAVLILGGYSPWQEDFVHIYRDALEYGVAVCMPTLHTVMAAIGQRVGMPVTGIGRMRRKAAISRALKTTLRPAAEASAETVGSWLAGARQGLSAALHPNQSSALMRRLQAIETPRRAVSVRALPPGSPEESSSRWAAISPLARISPLRLPALPAPGSSSPSASAARWQLPAPKVSTAAESAGLSTGAPLDSTADDAADPSNDASPSSRPGSPFEPETHGDGAVSESSQHAAEMSTRWLSPVERGPWSSGLRALQSDAPSTIPDVAADPMQPKSERNVPPDTDTSEDESDEYDTIVVEPEVESSGGATLAEVTNADGPDERDLSRDATQLLTGDPSHDSPSPNQLGPTTLLRGREPGNEGERNALITAAAAAASLPEIDPETLRVLVSIDDLPPTRQLSERTVQGLTSQTPEQAGVAGDQPGDGSADHPHDAVGAQEPDSQPRVDAVDGARAPSSTGPRPYTRLSRKYVVRRLPRHIGHDRGRPGR